MVGVLRGGGGGGRFGGYSRDDGTEGRRMISCV